MNQDQKRGAIKDVPKEREEDEQGLDTMNESSKNKNRSEDSEQGDE